MFSQLWNCNRLWKIWYTIFITFLQGYVIFNGIRQYINFKSQYYNPRYGGLWDFVPLHFYVSCIIASVALMAFFLYFSLVNVQRKSGASVRFLLDKDEQQSSFTDIFKMVLKLIQEKLPYSHILHFVIAACLLVPLPVVHMEEIRNEALTPDSIWATNIDFFSEHFQWFKPDSLSSAASLQNIHYITKSSLLSLEFLNFVTASILILLKLPSIFWSSHKCFSIIYSVLICSHCINMILIYESGSILIKCAGNTKLLTSVNDSITTIQYPVLLVLLVVLFVLTLLNFLAIFAYGNTQTVSSLLLGYKSPGLSNHLSKRLNCLITLVIVIGFSLLTFILVITALIYSTIFRHFQAFKTTLFMVTIIVGVVNLVINFLIWFTFAIKTNWTFNLEQNKTRNNNDNALEQGYKLAGSPDAIYGCFHNNITLSSSSSHSSGPGTMRTLEGVSSDCSGHGNNYQNYIYMQANALQIPTISEENQTATILKCGQQSRDKISTSTFDESTTSNGRDIVSISDNGINHSSENINSDSYRSLQLYGGRKFGKLVKFEGMNEEIAPESGGFYDKRFATNNFTEKDLPFLKVPDILNLNRSNRSCSHSESSLDQLSSSASSKMAVDASEQGMCSEV